MMAACTPSGDHLVTDPIEKDAVLAAVKDKAPRGVHVAEVCAAINVPKQDRDRVLDVLEELASLGLVKQMPGNRFRIAKPRGRGAARELPPSRRRVDEVMGRLTMHPSGFGFLAADDGGPDVFIPPPAVGAALHGDRVRAHARPSPKGRDGEIVEVLVRASRRVGGVLRRAGGNTWIDPDDARMRGPMPVVGSVPKEARPGLQVVCEILRYPRFADEVPEVELVEVLGAQGITEVEVAKLKLRDNVVEEFPEEVLAEAQDVPDKVLPSEKKEREDLRDYDLVTIDPSNARDHDDAVYVKKRSGGGWLVVVAIADVSHYVRPGTAIDREAFERGCSIYLPDRAIPMLPRELSSELASLVAGKDRLTMAVEMELAENGSVEKHRLIEGMMRSRAFLTYEGVAAAIGLSEAPERQKEAEKRADDLQVLFDLSRVLRKRRMKRGALDFDLPEARVLMDERNIEPIDIYRQKRDPGIRLAYQMIEELMLLANEVVAADLERRGVPAIYRVHGQPDEEKILRFVELANAFGYRIDPESALNPKRLSKFIRKIEGTEHHQALSYLLLRAMQQATYDTNNVGHFGLAAKSYLHFTSPIRRYPDLAVHRVVRSVIRGESIDEPALRRELRMTALESSRLERRAMQLERDVVDLYRAVLMRDRVGEEFDAKVSGVAAHGFYSAFDEPFVEALTPIAALDDWYEMDDLGIRLSGRRTGRSFSLGDRVRVRLEDVSIERRQLVALPTDMTMPEPGEERTSERRPDRRPQKGGPRETKQHQRRRREDKVKRREQRKKKNESGKKGRRSR